MRFQSARWTSRPKDSVRVSALIDGKANACDAKRSIAIRRHRPTLLPHHRQDGARSHRLWLKGHTVRPIARAAEQELGWAPEQRKRGLSGAVRNDFGAVLAGKACELWPFLCRKGAR